MVTPMNILPPILRVAIIAALLSGTAYAFRGNLQRRERERVWAERLEERTVILRAYLREQRGDLYALRSLEGDPAIEHARLISLADRVERLPSGEDLYSISALCTWVPKDEPPFRYFIQLKIHPRNPCPVISHVEVYLPEY
jgi:hypothetical protein